jgi:hypothetical protein
MRERAVFAERLVVPDVLRGFAIMAMLVAHSSPLIPLVPAPVALIISSLNDLASPLFALVMGMAAAIVLGRVPATRRSIAIAIVQNTVRGLILVALGIWLSTWGSWIAIVLAPLGFTLIVGAPLLFLRARWIVFTLVITLVVGSPVVGFVSAVVPPDLSQTSPLGYFLVSTFFTNPHYRVLSLLPFFLAGALLLRHGFARDRLLIGLAIAAPLTYVVRPLWTHFTTVPVFSGSYPDTLHDIGLVLAVYVVAVSLAGVTGLPGRSVVSVVFLPLRGIGSLALSIYVLQVGVVALIGLSQPSLSLPGNHYLLAAAIIIGVPAVGLIWWAFLGTGPIERAMRFITGRQFSRKHHALS